MNIVALTGSPRSNGASATLVRYFLAKTEERGFRPIVHELNSLTYRGCQGCYACKTSREDCILQDDLTLVLADVATADVLVLATPVYFGDPTAQLKGFIDRTFSYFTPDYRTSTTPSRLAPGKKLVFIQTQNNPDETFYADIFPKYAAFLKRNSFGEAHLIRARGVSSSDDIAQNVMYQQQVAQVAEAVFGRHAAVSGDPLVQW
jgi:multimeric flavodoxin WrbA